MSGIPPAIQISDIQPSEPEVSAPGLRDYSDRLKLNLGFAISPGLLTSHMQLLFDNANTVALLEGNMLRDFVRTFPDLKMRGGNLIWHDHDATAPWLMTLAEQYPDKYPEFLRCMFRNRREGAADLGINAIAEILGTDGSLLKESSVYKYYGDRFPFVVCQLAREEMPGTKLFYSEHRTRYTEKWDAVLELCRQLKEQDLIDGVVPQTHWDVFPNPDLVRFENYVSEFQKMGLEVQLGEISGWCGRLAMANVQRQIEQDQPALYAGLVDLAIRRKIDTIIFWTLTDKYPYHWLSERRDTSYPGLFDREGKPKPCYFAVEEVLKNAIASL